MESKLNEVGDMLVPENRTVWPAASVFGDNVGTIADSPVLEWIGENGHTGRSSAGRRIPSGNGPVASLSAVRGLGGVSITWTTEAEVDTAGFNLYRSVDGENYSRVNDGLIMSAGSPETVADYSFVDRTRETRVLSGRSLGLADREITDAGEFVFYSLELVYDDGSTVIAATTELEFVKDSPRGAKR